MVCAVLTLQWGHCSCTTLDQCRAGARLLFVNMRAFQGRGHVHASSRVVKVGCVNVYYLQVKRSLHVFTLTVSVRLLPSRVNAAKTVPT